MRKAAIIMTVFALLFSGFTGCSQTVQTEKDYNTEQISKEVTSRNMEFAFDLFKELNKEEAGSNIFLSPLSISAALSMTYNGAAGDTLAHMERGLRYEGIEKEKVNSTWKHLLAYLPQADKKVDLTISNSVWYRQGEEIKENFINTNKQTFHAEVREMDFSDPKAANTINSWIKKSTKGKIAKMIEPPIPGNVVMYLINAVYFKGDWQTPFKKEDTFETEFYGTGKSQKIDMMSRYGNTDYGEGDDYKIVRLPYGNGKVVMYAILPEGEQDINSFIQNLDAQKFKSMQDSVSSTEKVELKLPRFKMEYGIKQINDQLISMGMELPFSPLADFSEIRGGLFISQVLHKAVIEVNEEGSEASGATVVVMDECAALDPVAFIADRPFLFLIAEKETDTILFMGKYCNVE